MPVCIKQALTPQERAAAYEFRYKIYVEEMHRYQRYADHAAKTVEEPLDASGHVLIAVDGNQIVGTVRLNVGVDAHFGIYDQLYNLRAFGSFYPHSLSITTKFMVAQRYRCSTLPVQMALECYRIGTSLGSYFDIIDCNPHLVELFKRLGYRQVFPSVMHPEYGQVVPMVLAGYDTEYLRMCRSPFARLAARRVDHLDSVPFFYEGLCSKEPVVAEPLV